MARLLFLVATVGAVTVGCSTSTSTQEQQPNAPMQAQAAPPPAPEPVAIPENPADLAIRRDLTAAIAGDADLRARGITFVVNNGDISVTGIVRTEEERRKINGLAMAIDGVKSVANALRVAE